jgi:hypothetical protein
MQLPNHTNLYSNHLQMYYQFFIYTQSHFLQKKKVIFPIFWFSNQHWLIHKVLSTCIIRKLVLEDKFQIGNHFLTRKKGRENLISWVYCKATKLKFTIFIEKSDHNFERRKYFFVFDCKRCEMYSLPSFLRDVFYYCALLT